MSDSHRLGYWKERRAKLRAAKGDPPHSDYDHLFVQQGKELAMMMAAVAVPKIGRVLDHMKCPCGQPHRQVTCSQPVRAPAGGWNVTWYCSHSCKGKHGTRP